MMKISASARPPSGANERKASRLEWVMLSAQQLGTHRLSITASSRRTAQDDGRGRPLAEALRVALRVERRLVRLSQHEGVVDSEGAELLAVGQKKAEVLARQGHQLQRDRDA